MTLIGRVVVVFVAVLGVLGCQAEPAGRGTGEIDQVDTYKPTADEDLVQTYDDCIEVELNKRAGFMGDVDGGWRFKQTLDEDLVIGGKGAEKFGGYLDLDFRSPATGEFDLADRDNDSFGRCQQCVRVDIEAGEFFQVEGTIEIDEYARLAKGELEVELSEVVLAEVDIDPDTYDTEFVEDGMCIRVAGAKVRELQPPPGWTCPPGLFGSGDDCNCGCGKPDPDCDDSGINACDVCNDRGSCNCRVPGNCSQRGEAAECDAAMIDTHNNAQCDPAASWTCDLASFGGGDGCDCGCGLVDPDCENNHIVSCDGCGLPGSCAESAEAFECQELVRTRDNSQCL